MRALVPLVLLTACNKDPKPTLVLDEAVVAEVLTSVTTAVPYCTTGAASTARVVTDALAPLRRIRPPDGPMFAGTSSTGSCGGALDVTMDHADGITDYVVTMTDLCLTGEAGDVVWNGTLVGKEIGTPSDSGPVIEAFELRSDGPLEIGVGDSTVTAEITDARADYGVPAAWYPGEPTASNPDVVEVGQIAVTLGASGDRYTVDNLRYEAVGAFFTTEIAVTGGVLEGPNGTVTVRTDEGAPLSVMLAGGSVTDGGLVLGGAKDTRLELRPDETTIGAVDLTLNGAPYPDTLDCSAGVAPTVEFLMALTSALPIY